MANNEKWGKWVELFEKVIGRKPTADELIQAEKVNFDFKAIKQIADLSSENSSRMNISEVQEITPESISTSVSEPEERLYQSEQLVAQQEVETKEQWLADFNQLFGRKPRSEEFVFGKQANFSSESLESLVSHYSAQSVSNKSAKKPILKGKMVIFALLVVLAVGIGAIFFYFKSTTGIAVTAKEFTKAVDSHNYNELADMLSDKDTKWNKEESKDFVAYLDEHVENLDSEVEKSVKSQGKEKVKDNQENSLIGFEQKGKKLWIFPEYRVVSYPVQVAIQTNLDGATVTKSNNETVKLNKDSVTEIGDFSFVSEPITLKGNAEFGEIESVIPLDTSKIRENKLTLDLKADRRKLTAKLPDNIGSPEDIKLSINGKEVGSDLVTDISVVMGQELEVVANFKVDDEMYATKKANFTVTEKELEVQLELSSDAQEKLKNKVESTSQSAEQKKAEITNFISDYRSAVFRSISNRSNDYAKYYDTSSSAYNEMIEWTTGGGVVRAKIDYYTPGALEIKSVNTENGNYVVQTYEDFTVHYIDNTPNSVSRKNKVYYLRPVGDTFVIYDLAVVD